MNSEKMKTKEGRTLTLPTDEEDARILAAALSDPDAQPLTDEQLRNAVPLREMPEKLARLKAKAARGVQKKPTKVAVSIRLDPDVVEHFKASGQGWQSRINAALRRVAFGQGK